MNGVRLCGVSPGTARTHIVEFLRQAGLDPETLYYPLLNNDAVVVFHDGGTTAKALCTKLGGATKFVVHPLPHKIFSQVTVLLEDNVSALFSSSKEYKKTINKNTNKEIRISRESDGSTSMTGDCYDLELAEKLLSDLMEDQYHIQHGMVNGHYQTVAESDAKQWSDCGTRGTGRLLHADKAAHRSPVSNDHVTNGYEKELTGKGFSPFDRMNSIDDNVGGRCSRDRDASKTFSDFTSLHSIGSEHRRTRAEPSEPSRNSSTSVMSVGADRGTRSAGSREHTLSGNEVDEEFSTSLFDRNESMLRELDQFPSEERRELEACLQGEKASTASGQKATPIPSPRGQKKNTGKVCSDGGSDKDAISKVIQRRQDMKPSSSKDQSEDYLRFNFKLHGDIDVQVYYGDIINCQTEVIVNAANPNLEHYAGVAGALERACGRGMKRECESYVRLHGPLDITKVMHTSAGDLHPTRHIIHAVGPVYIKSMDRSCGNQLTGTFLRCLNYAHRQLVVGSIAFPFISTGVFAVPLDICVEAFLDAVVMFFDSHHSETYLKEIHLVNMDVEMVQTAIVMLRQHLDQAPETLVQRALSRLQSKAGVDRSPREDRSEPSRSRNRTSSLTRDSRLLEKTSAYSTDQASNSVTPDRYGRADADCRPLSHAPHRERSGSLDVPSSRRSPGARTKSASAASATEKKLNSTPKPDLSRTMPNKYGSVSPSIDKVRRQPSSQGSNSPRSGPMKATRTTGLEYDGYEGSTKEHPDPYLYPRSRKEEPSFQSLPVDLNSHGAAMQDLYQAGGARAASRDADEVCSICMDTPTRPKALSKCGHVFCKDCISTAFEVKPVCPVCGMLYGVVTGDQPRGGSMTSRVDMDTSVAGYRDARGVIIIEYKFPGGKQQSCHPNPGSHYIGIQRTAYLPNNREGREVRRLLERSFDAGLTFTIGVSRTTGQTGVITWNDIHHKTSTTGGSTGYGYPDPDYLKRVKEELALKGIVQLTDT